MRRTVLMLFVVAVLAAPSFGALAFYDGFDQTAGNPAAPWTNTEPMAKVSEPGLTYTGLETVGGKIGGNVNDFWNAASVVDNAAIGSLWGSTGSFYMTFLGQRAYEYGPNYMWSELSLRPDGGTAGGTPHFRVWMPFRDNTYNGYAGLQSIVEFAGESAADSASFWWGSDGAAKGFAVKFTMDAASGQDDTVQIVHNPATFASEPNWAASTWTLTADVTPASAANNADTVNFVARNWDPGHFDEIRIGTTWGSVIPEPTTLAMIGLSGLALLLKRRS